MIERLNNIVEGFVDVVGRLNNIVGRFVDVVGRLNNIVGSFLDVIGRLNKIVGSFRKAIEKLFLKKAEDCEFQTPILETSKLGKNDLREAPNGLR